MYSVDPDLRTALACRVSKEVRQTIMDTWNRIVEGSPGFEDSIHRNDRMWQEIVLVANEMLDAKP